MSVGGKNDWIPGGQRISFGIEDGGDQRFTGFRYIHVTKADRTIADIAAKYAHREQAQYIANLNGIRWVESKLKIGRLIKVPDGLRKSDALHVYAGDTAPTVMGGYAKIDVVARTERTGLSIFQGYDPITLSIPIRFEADDVNVNGDRKGQQVEDDIKKLERMAGRGEFGGAAVGPPPLVRISTTGSNSRPIPLIPSNYAWDQDDVGNSPIYWIGNIDWDDDPWRNESGNRVRQLATVTAIQYVSPRPDAHSLAIRERIRTDKKGTLIARRQSGRIVGRNVIDDLP